MNEKNRLQDYTTEELLAELKRRIEGIAVEPVPKSAVKQKIMLTIKEAAEYSGMSYDAIRKKCVYEGFPHIRAGTKYLINKDNLDELMKTGKVTIK